MDSPECLDRIVWMARYQHVPSLVVMDSNEGLDDPVLDAVVTPRLNELAARVEVGLPSSARISTISLTMAMRVQRL